MSGSVGQLTSVHNRADSSGALRGLRMALFFSARLQANRSSPFGLTLLTTTTIFRVSRGAATAAVVLIVLAMFLYRAEHSAIRIRPVIRSRRTS